MISWMVEILYIYNFLLGWPIFRGELLVSGRVGHAENLLKNMIGVHFTPKTTTTTTTTAFPRPFRWKILEDHIVESRKFQVLTQTDAAPLGPARLSAEVTPKGSE